MPQAVIDIQLFQDNPANDIIYEYNSDGDNYECTVHSKGNDPWTEKSKIGQVKVLDMGEMGVYHVGILLEPHFLIEFIFTYM